MKIILAPYSARLINGAQNPKNFPWWAEVIAKLNSQGFEIIQIGVTGEDRIEGVSQFVTNWPLKKLRDLIDDSVCFLSCDSFLPHYCHVERLKAGVVIFSQSDPNIFGHPENINLLKDRKYLRRWQYDSWMAAEYREDAFVSPDEVVAAVNQLVVPAYA